MSCERMGHSGMEDHHIQPKYRCIYCGSWGFSSSWYDEDKELFLECDCDKEYYEHLMECE